MQKYIVCTDYTGKGTATPQVYWSTPYDTKKEAVDAGFRFVQSLAGRFRDAGPGDGAGARWVRQNLEMGVTVALHGENEVIRVWIEEIGQS